MNDEAHPCVDKKVYLFKHQAQRRAQRDSKRHKRNMKVYQCPRCGFYHLARKNK